MFENNVSDTNGWSLGKLNNVREVFGEEELGLRENICLMKSVYRP